MDAARIQQVLEHWEETGEITHSEFQALQSAIEQNHEDAGKLKPLLPLLKRDAEATSEIQNTSRIMQSVLAEKTAGTSKTTEQPIAAAQTVLNSTDDAPGTAAYPQRRFGAGMRALTLAASLVLVVGAASIVGYSLGYHRGSGNAETTIVETSEHSDTVTVQFRVAMPEAADVSLVGDFNDWDPQATPLTLAEDGVTWNATLDLRDNRAYSYNFVIDGELVIPDPTADRTIPDSFGGEKSVISL